MGTGNYNDITSYSISAMEDLKEDVVKIKTEFTSLKEELKTNVADIYNYWNTADPEAEKTYEDLKGKHNTFDGKLDTAVAYMEEYIKEIDNQIQKYTTANTKTKSSLE